MCIDQTLYGTKSLKIKAVHSLSCPGKSRFPFLPLPTAFCQHLDPLDQHMGLPVGLLISECLSPFIFLTIVTLSVWKLRFFCPKCREILF